MAYRFLLVLFFIITVSFTASFCAPKIQSVRIQVLSFNIKDLSLSDTCHIAIIANIYKDTRSDSLIKAKYPADSLLTVKTAIAMKNKLEQSPLFNNYDFPVYNYEQKDTHFSENILSLDIAKQLANDVQANYLLTVDLKHSEIWYEIAYNEAKNESYASTNVHYFFVFGLYNIHENKIKDIQEINDTLVIETSSNKTSDPMSLFKQIIIANEAVYKACEQAGEIYAEMITPCWKDEIRYYYTDNENAEMNIASKYVGDNQWDKAKLIWEKYLLSPDSVQASMACFNMALYCELNDNFDLAIEWLNLSIKKYPDISAVSEYKKQIEKRLYDKQKHVTSALNNSKQ
jgi:tetratricopeptide (TPR) repeat protein